MKTLTMTVSDKQNKTQFQNADEGELCRIASSGDYLVGMDSAKAGTTVKVSEVSQTRDEAVELYKNYYMTSWHLPEADALEIATQDVDLMASLANHFEVGDKALVKVSKSGRISIKTL